MRPIEHHLRILVNDLAIGGTETHLSRILPVLVKQYGWKIKLFLFSDQLDLAPVLYDAGVKIYYPKLPAFVKRLCGKKGTRFLNTLLGFCRVFVDFCVDRTSITHFFLARAYIVGMCAAILTRLPADKYMSRRSLNDYQQSVFGSRRIETKLHPKMRRILVNSQRITEQLVENEGVSPDKVIKIYNGLQEILVCYQNRALYREILIKEQNLSTDTWIFITVANLIPYKGHVDLLSALSQLTTIDTGGRPWRLLCVGTDAGSGYAAELRQQAVTLGIGDKVSWLGKQSTVFALYAGSDIGFLCSYRNEGFSNALLEGMAIGLPLIVTDVGGNAEAVAHRETGLVVPAQNSLALATAISTLCQNPDMIEAYGVAGRQRVQKKFSLSQCVSAYHAVYTTVSLVETMSSVEETKSEIMEISDV
jgi:glycosyltransferase involved in cell wall biosynthesis